MSARAHAFRQSDLTKAFRAAKAAGVAVDEIVITPRGDIRLRVKGEDADCQSRSNDFDREFG